MKFFLSIVLFSLSISSFASCRIEARNIAEEAVSLFNINDQNVHCSAVGSLISLKSKPVIMVMPPRYAFEATFDYPCGPQPKSPKVSMLLNQECKIVDLKVSGFKLKNE